MSLDFNVETFRNDFTFKNSDKAIKRFPFPFPEDSYMYSVNMEPHVPGPKGSVFEHTFDVDEHYVAEMRDRAQVLAEDPLRCQSLPHMTLAGWDLLELIMESKARDYPQWFSSIRSSPSWTSPPCLMGRWNISRGRRRGISPCRINGMRRCGSMLAWSPPKPTGALISTSA
jgi:hypothetical protein